MSFHNSFYSFVCTLLFYILCVFVDDYDYSTPGTSAAAPIIIPGSVTPRTQLRTVRVIQPSKALLPPFVYIIPAEEEIKLYNKVIKHTKEEPKSKIKEYVFL